MFKKFVSVLSLLSFSCSHIAARPEQAVPSGGGEFICLVDLNRPVQLVAGMQSMVGEMILSVADKCEDPQDAKAVLCFRHLRAGIINAHSLAIFANGENGVFVLEASLAPKFEQKIKSAGKLRTFGRHRAIAATFGNLWGDEAGSLKDDVLVLGPGGRLLLGDDSSIAGVLQTLSSRECYLPTFGRDTGVHYSARPTALGLGDYEKLGARLFVMDLKVGASGLDAGRFELKCDTSRQALALRPKVVSDYVNFFSPILHKIFLIKDPDLSLAQVQKVIREGLSKDVRVKDNSIILEFDGGEFDMNPQQIRAYIEEMVLMAFQGE